MATTEKNIAPTSSPPLLLRTMQVPRVGRLAFLWPGIECERRRRRDGNDNASLSVD